MKRKIEPKSKSNQKNQFNNRGTDKSFKPNNFNKNSKINLLASKLNYDTNNKPNRFNNKSKFDKPSNYRGKRKEESDEEILSDEAFNSEDEKKWGSIFESIASKKNKKQTKKEGEEEEEEEYEENEEPEDKFMTITDLLEGSGEDDDNDDDDDDEIEFDSEEETKMKSNNSENHDNFLKSLKGALGMGKKVIKGSLKEEGEYKKNPYIESSNLKLEDLYQNLDENKQEVESLKQDFERLNKTKPTVQPLEEFQVKTMNRSIAFKEVKKDVDKWDSIIKLNREVRKKI